MTGDRDLETRLRRHLAAEAGELPFLLDAGTVEARLGAHRRRWHRVLLATAAIAALAVIIGQPWSPGSERGHPGGSAGWGPLAVMEMSGGMDALTTGVLRITDRCVVLETPGGESELLVWPADGTRWDADTGTIHFTSPPSGPEFVLRDGQSVSLGGGGDSTAESGVSGAEWAASVNWVAAPDSSCPTEIRWYVSAVSEQGPAAGANVIVESGEFPGIEIACRGEVYLDLDACRDWGDGLVAASPIGPDRVTLLVLTANAGDARCAADYYVRADQPPAATAAVACLELPVPASGATPGPQQNYLEATIVDALAVLRLDGHRAEYSPTSAFIRVPLDEGAEFYVRAFPTGADAGEFLVRDERVIAGRTIRLVEYEAGPVRDRFDCANITYEVEGATPLGYATRDALLAELVPLLGCAAAGGE